MFCTNLIVYEINNENELEGSNFVSNRKVLVIVFLERFEYLKRV